MDFMLRIISQGIEGYEHFVRDIWQAPAGLLNENKRGSSSVIA